jgi:hypothetical protein
MIKCFNIFQGLKNATTDELNSLLPLVNSSLGALSIDGPVTLSLAKEQIELMKQCRERKAGEYESHYDQFKRDFPQSSRLYSASSSSPSFTDSDSFWEGGVTPPPPPPPHRPSSFNGSSSPSCDPITHGGPLYARRSVSSFDLNNGTQDKRPKQTFVQRMFGGAKS